MGTGYSRNDAVNNIASGKRANAADIDGEFDALEAAFDESTGHTHDGTADEGGYVPLIADSDAKNKVVVDTSNNRVGVFVEVAAAATEQVRIQDGAVVPVTDDDVDLGAVGQEFKDLYVDGVAYIDDIRGPLTGNVTGNLTGNVTAASGSSEFNNITVNGTADFTNTPLVNVSDPTSAQEAATKNYVDTQIAAVIDTAPGTLDTLNELAAALGDDPSFATTVATSIGTKVSKAGDSMTGELAMGSNKITGLGTPTTGTDATTKTYVDSVLGSATAAADSAAAAAVSEANAAASYDSFDDRYLGAKASEPTLDNDGDALIEGAIYWNSTEDQLYIYTGSAWTVAVFDLNGALVAANNLSDLTSASTARTNLGLGTGATATIADYAPLAGTVTLTGGFDSDEEALGTITSGTVTPEVDAANKENFKSLTNNGAFTLAPPSTSSATTIRIRVINAASAGAITTSGFDKVNDPDSYATTNAKEYWFYIDHDSARSTLTISEIV